jgi:integrase
VLTDAKIRAAKPGPKVRRLFDEKGLHLQVKPNGSKTWVLKFTLDGRERRAGLGVYPDVSLKEARDTRDDMRRQIRDGIDPITQRRQAKEARKLGAAATVEKIARAWLESEKVRASWTPGYHLDTRAAFERHVFAKLGMRPIASVTAGELLDHVFTPMTAGGERLEAARRLRQKLEKVWHYATVRGLVTSNPAVPVKGELKKHKAEHFTAITLDELPALLVGVRAYGNRHVEACVWLQLLTATRPGEARGARWSEFDLDGAVWRIPAGRMKKRREHVVPLSTQAVHLLRRLHQIALDDDVLFPSRSRPGVPMSDMVIGMVFRRVGFEGITSHGMRALFSSTANDDAVASPQVIEAALAHVLGETKTTTEAAYNRATHVEARKGVMQWWADRVEAVCAAYTATRHLGPLFPPLGPLA